MALRPFRWLPHHGKRHAVREDAAAHEDTTTICGEALTIPATRPTEVEWCWPTCADCDTTWRRHEGIPLFPRQRAFTPSVATTGHMRESAPAQESWTTNSDPAGSGKGSS